uniref:40S ribosomal protein S26 n=1 Tax=Heterorhabditis bacteriophora TaxID=37862 RepID=A0A1I7WD84_HETBA
LATKAARKSAPKPHRYRPGTVIQLLIRKLDLFVKSRIYDFSRLPSWLFRSLSRYKLVRYSCQTCDDHAQGHPEREATYVYEYNWMFFSVFFVCFVFLPFVKIIYFSIIDFCVWKITAMCVLVLSDDDDLIRVTSAQLCSGIGYVRAYVSLKTESGAHRGAPTRSHGRLVHRQPFSERLSSCLDSEKEEFFASLKKLAVC